MTTDTALDLLAHAAATVADRCPDLARMRTVAAYTETLLRALELADLEVRLNRLLEASSAPEERV